MRRQPTLYVLSPVLALAACAEPPPESLSEDAKKAREHTELRDAIQTPINKAKGVEDVQEKQAEDQRDAIEDQGG